MHEHSPIIYLRYWIVTYCRTHLDIHKKRFQWFAIASDHDLIHFAYELFCIIRILNINLNDFQLKFSLYQGRMRDISMSYEWSNFNFKTVLVKTFDFMYPMFFKDHKDPWLLILMHLKCFILAPTVWLIDIIICTSPSRP